MTATTRPGLRRRLDRRLLRAQGRLDSENSDRFLPWIAAVVAFLVFTSLQAARIRSLDGGSGLAPWLQAAWRRDNAGAGVPMTGDDPARATWSFVSEVLLQIARVVPPETVFVVAQSTALALAIIPLWRLARSHAHLRVGAASVLVLAYVLAPTLHRALLGSFHPELLALPALIAAYDRGKQDQWVRFGLLLGFAVLCRADLGLTAAALGLLFVLEGRRPAIGAVVGGIAWTTVAHLVISPSIPDEALTPAGEFVARARLPLAVVPEVANDPWSTIRDLVAEPSVLFIVVVLSPLLFLPVVSPRRFAVAGPALVLAMLADQEVQRLAGRGVLDLSPAAAHIAPAMAFVFVALVFSVERIGQESVTRVNVDRRVLWALLAGATLLFATESPASPYERPWDWGARDVVDGARLEAADMVEEDDAIAASPQVSALVAGRAHLIELAPHPSSLADERLESLTKAVDVVFLDTTVAVDDDGQPQWTPEVRQEIIERFSDAGFVVVYDAQGVLLLRSVDP